jgi:hypothetical protein
LSSGSYLLAREVGKGLESLKKFVDGKEEENHEKIDK